MKKRYLKLSDTVQTEIYKVSGDENVSGIPIQEEPKKEKTHTQTAIHLVSQYFADGTQLSLFSDKKVDDFVKSTNINLTDKPKSYGVVLKQTRKRVLEGILKAFADSNYLGKEQVKKEDEFRNRGLLPKTQKGADIIESVYRNVNKFPVVRLTQSEILKLSGYERRHEDKMDVTEAISFLATKQFCFYWMRLKTENGKVVKNKNGDFVKEEVMEVGTLFRIRVVREDGILQYYEISPSGVIIDQVNKNYGGNYFLLIPDNWRDEVKKITGKRASNYTYEFLLWLRLQFERIRRYNDKREKKKPFIIKQSWEETAEILKMPETLYKRNRVRANKMISDAYDIALKLGYLKKIESNGVIDIIYLNEEYFPQPGELR